MTLPLEHWTKKIINIPLWTNQDFMFHVAWVSSCFFPSSLLGNFSPSHPILPSRGPLLAPHILRQHLQQLTVQQHLLDPERPACLGSLLMFFFEVEMWEQTLSKLDGQHFHQVLGGEIETLITKVVENPYFSDFWGEDDQFSINEEVACSPLYCEKVQAKEY